MEKPRFLKFTYQPGQRLRGERLLQRIVAGSQVTLRQLVRPDEGLARQVQHQVEGFLAFGRGARKIDRADGAAGLDAVAVRLALRKVDLVGEIDRLLGTGAHAGVAARADFKVDRILLAPFDREGAE